tara:strand:+ start:4113 stop:4409 length:297 start_codon:yes stop_codon:yes gene_type:complete
LTLGLSQENSGQICLPEEQVRILFEDAQKYSICDQTLNQLEFVINKMDSIIIDQDSLLIVLEQEIELQNSMLKENSNKDTWWIQGFILIGGVLFGKIL